MNNPTKYYLFLDESGDHGLGNIDPTFPVFVLSGILISEENYEILHQQFNQLKNKHPSTKNNTQRCTAESQMMCTKLHCLL